MGAQERTQQIDAILLRFLEAADETEASQLLEQLINEHVLPLVKDIVRSNLRGTYWLQDTEDLTAEVVLQLVKKLRDMKSNPAQQTVSSFRGYVAVAAYNACYEYLRKKYPERSRLKDKLRYVLTHQDNFALWESRNRQWLCGLASWQHSDMQPLAPSRLTELGDGEISSAAAEFIREQARSADPAQLMTSIFNWTGRPVEFDAMVDAVAHLWRVSDGAVRTVDINTEVLADSRENIITRLEQRLYLQRLWGEICELPIQQRRALLLNLRDSQGHDIITLLSHSRIASLRELANTLEMKAEELAEVWNRLPLDDASIAARLGLTRQQVINLRNAARRRLSRRMKKFEKAE